MKRLYIALCLALTLGASANAQQKIEKQRLFVLSDVENEPDDNESFVRLMTYSNQIDLEGLVATTSTHMRDRVCPQTIQKVVKAYGKVRENLLKHEAGYPTEEFLMSLIKSGAVAYGMRGVGEGHDSEGSKFLLEALEKNDERPLWVVAWGGVNTLAQALYDIRATKSKKEAQKLYAKLRVYTISDQDDAGPWIRKEFPSVFYIVSPGFHYDNATWRGINVLDPGSNAEVVSDKWLAENIQQGHGPLGAVYPDVAYSMEGDSPSWMYLIPNGLNVPEHPELGGWGGRYTLQKPAFQVSSDTYFNPAFGMKEPFVMKGNADPSKENCETPETRAIWTNTPDSVVVNGKGYKSTYATIWRWREDYQNDFAARMDWCTKPYAEANHAPVVVLTTPSEMTVKSGETFRMDAFDSYDPDGDSMSFQWIYYPEASTCQANLRLFPANIHELKVIAPEVKKKEVLQFIVRVTDKGTPALSRYARIAVTVLPK